MYFLLQFFLSPNRFTNLFGSNIWTHHTFTRTEKTRIRRGKDKEMALAFIVQSRESWAVQFSTMILSSIYGIIVQSKLGYQSARQLPCEFEIVTTCPVNTNPEEGAQPNLHWGAEPPLKIFLRGMPQFHIYLLFFVYQCQISTHCFITELQYNDSCISQMTLN